MAGTYSGTRDRFANPRGRAEMRRLARSETPAGEADPTEVERRGDGEAIGATRSCGKP